MRDHSPEMGGWQLAEPARLNDVGLSKGSPGGFAYILIHVGTWVYDTRTACVRVSAVVGQQ